MIVYVCDGIIRLLAGNQGVIGKIMFCFGPQDDIT